MDRVLEVGLQEQQAKVSLMALRDDLAYVKHGCGALRQALGRVTIGCPTRTGELGRDQRFHERSSLLPSTSLSALSGSPFQDLSYHT